MAVIYVDGKSLHADGADNLLQALLSLGYDVPYFCYHPALGSVGSCRQCAVKQYNNEDDYKAGRGRLVMSCMVNPTDNMYISIDDSEAAAFRKRIVEYLMTNHPHDCPTCEEGGHCHLQDMTYMSGHQKRRYRFAKRTHHNQDLGVFINHEMNRCIACYRCVRFYKDYAGGEDFGVYASNNRVYFGRETDGQFDSEFSGNLTEVCPTGVFTDKTHSDRYNRKWDMQYAPSICQGCSTGCSISAGERYGELRRIENRYNHDVNGYFLCDRGRFGYGYVSRADRPTQALEKTDDKFIKVSANFALDGVLALLKDKRTIGIGSARASLENNFALKKLVGDDYYSTGELLHTQKLIDKSIELLRHQSVVNVSLSQIESSDCVIVIGEDLTQTAPRVALSVRQATKNKAKAMAAALKTQDWLAEPVKRIGQNAYSPLYTLGVIDGKLDDVAKTALVATPSDIAKLTLKVASVINGFGDDLKKIPKELPRAVRPQTTATGVINKESDSVDNDIEDLAYHIAYDLIMADRPLVVGGTSLQSADVVNATAVLATALSDKRQAVKTYERAYIETENAKRQKSYDEQMRQAQTIDIEKDAKPNLDPNAKGDEKLERKPSTKPLELLHENTYYADKAGVYMVVPQANSVGVALLDGASIEEILAKDFEVALILEHDLLALSEHQREALFAKSLIVLDHQSYAWHSHADYVLSVASFAEGDGTLVSAEGRAQRFFAVFDSQYYQPTHDIKDAWRWLGAINSEKNGATLWQSFDEVFDELVTNYADFAPLAQNALHNSYRIMGLKVAREPRRYSGRTAMRAKISVHEPMQPKDLSSPLTFSMEGYVGDKTNPNMLPFVYAAGWHSPQAWNKYQDKVGGVLKGGDVGIRLFDHLPKTATVYEDFVIKPSRPSSLFEERASLVPVYDLFASGMLSHRSEVVASQITPPAFYINQDDATKWLIKQGDHLAIIQNDIKVICRVEVVDYLADGCIGYVANQSGLCAYLPAVVKKTDDPPTPSVYQLAQKSLLGLSKQSLSAFNAMQGRNNLGLSNLSLNNLGLSDLGNLGLSNLNNLDNLDPSEPNVDLGNKRTVDLSYQTLWQANQDVKQTPTNQHADQGDRR